MPAHGVIVRVDVINMVLEAVADTFFLSTGFVVGTGDICFHFLEGFVVNGFEFWQAKSCNRCFIEFVGINTKAVIYK